MFCVTVLPVAVHTSVVPVDNAAISVTAITCNELAQSSTINFATLVQTQVTLIPGRKGDKGDRGDAGPPGGGTFEWSPPTALVTWIIPHNLNRYPSMTLTDTDGEIVGGRATYLDANTIMLEFTAPFIGTMFLN